jgi:hypothetical protein
MPKHPSAVLLVLAALAALVPLAAPETARAQNRGGLLAIPEVTTNLERAINAHAMGDNIAALESLWAAQETIWNNAPLAVRNVAFVADAPETFGLYTPKVGEDFSDEDVIALLYFEVFGFTQNKGPDGGYGYSLTVSATILDTKGNIVGVERNPTVYEKSGFRTFNAQCMLVSSLNLRGLPPGSYVMKVTIQDNNDPTKVVEVEKALNRLPDNAGAVPAPGQP